MHPDQSTQADVRELAELIREIRVGMLTTVASNGMLVSRPLYTRDRDFDGDLWFFVGVDSDKVDELLDHPQVNIAYASPDKHHYVSIAGEAEIVRDRGRIQAFWNDRFDRLYFGNGPEDPDLALLRVQVWTAEIWNAGNNALVRGYNFMKAKLTGDGSELGHQRHVNLRGH